MVTPGPMDLSASAEEADSPDLTDEEVASSVDAVDSTAMVAILSNVRCGEEGCGQQMLPSSYAMRRRNPRIYSRSQLECGQGHTRALTITMVWMTRSSV